MKTTKLTVTGILAAVSLMLTCISSRAYVGPTNFMAYNFDTCPIQPIWSGSGEFGGAQCDPTHDSSNNPDSGSMVIEFDYQGGQSFFEIAASPSNSPVPIQGPVAFTNLQFDVMYYSAAPGLIRTNVSPWDFGYVRVGSREPSYAQDWFGYFAVPATNGLGQPNTSWVHIQVDLNNATNYPNLAANGLYNIMFNQDDSGLSGTQYIWFDNIQYNGWVSPPISWSAGAVILNLASVSGSTNRLWATTNISLPMTQWQVLATNVATNGFFQFMDTNTSGYPVKFYRLSTP